jgi:hypothetical protein
MRSMVAGARNERKIIHASRSSPSIDPSRQRLSAKSPLPPLFSGPPPPQAGEDERNGRMECAGTQGRTRA